MSPSEALQLAQEAGLTLPSTAWIVGCVLFSLIGLGIWRWGRAMRNRPVKWLGVALMLWGYVAGPTWLLYGGGIAMCAAAWWYRGERD